MKSLRPHMTATCWYGLLVVIITIAFFANNIYSQRKLAVEHTCTTTRTAVRFLAMDVDKTFYGVEQIFTGIRNLLDNAPAAATANNPTIHAILSDLKQHNKFLECLLVINPAGKIINWSCSGSHLDVSDRDYFTAHTAQSSANDDKMFIGKPIVSRLDGKRWIFGVSKAIRDSRGCLRYVLAGIFNIDYFYQRYTSLDFPPETVITIVAADGTMYLRTPGQQKFVGKRFPGVARILAGVTEFGSVKTISPVDQEPLLAGIERISGRNMYAAVAIKNRVFLQPWHEYARTMTLFCFIITIILLYFVSKAIKGEKQQILARKLLEKQAVTDPLTGLYNRRHTLTQADIEVKKAHRGNADPLAVIMMDIDHFKQINDTYGHEIGDKVLQNVAIVLRNGCRASDLLCRYGGEEFLIVMPNTSTAGAEISAEKIRRALQQHTFDINGNSFAVTASFGISEWQGEDDIWPALRRADNALYQAKNNGRNCICTH